MVALGSKMALRNCLAQVLEIWFVALLGGPLPSLFKQVPGSKVAPGQGSWVRTMEMHRNILKNLLRQNHLAQMFEIWYVALPSAPIPSLFK